MKKRKFRFRAEWRGTALKFWVEADSQSQAEKKAFHQVLNMLGGKSCLALHSLGEIHDK